MSESVKVAVRCRPMSSRELQQGCRSVVTIEPSSRSCTLESGGTGKIYQFDAAFGPESSTESVYEDVGSVIVEAVLDGYNGTVLAYGQTGCGKSHTMRGLVDRALEHLFEATSTASTATRYLAILSYLEIYNERLRDLLQESDASALVLKEDPGRGTYVAGGLRELAVKDARECARLVELGDRRRAAAATRMNAQSSRSHAVLSIALEAIAVDEPGEDDDGTGPAGNSVRRGKLHLVDLAGSERQTRTGAVGDRLKEAASINLSLSALGNVISALAAGNGRHVPYRDSKLTRLLRDSLGGNARTLMIACVSPSDVDAEETLSTLRYAARARCIKNKPIVNEDPKDALLRQYQLELQRLRKLLESGEQLPAEMTRDVLRTTTTGQEELEEVERLRRECEDSNLSAQRLREELDALKSRDERSTSPTTTTTTTTSPTAVESVVLDEQDRERAERRRRKREAAMREVLRRIERLTIGGEAHGDAELRRRRERRRKRLEALAGALEASAQEGNAGVFQVYGQLKSTEDALKRMARRVRQLETETADLQASWDAERRDLLRRELLMSQLCEAMVPHLRPGCPYRDVANARDNATWCDELGRWRLPDASAYRVVALPAPSAPRTALAKPDLNNNNDNNDDDDDDRQDDEEEDRDDDDDGDETNGAKEKTSKWDIVDTYFRRNRIDALLQHVREAKTFEPSGARLSKSGGSEESVPSSLLQISALNLQSSAPIIGESNTNKPSVRQLAGRSTGWLFDDLATSNPAATSFSPFATTLKRHPPRILEALPTYPQGGTKTTTTTTARNPFRLVDGTTTSTTSTNSRLSRPDDDLTSRWPTC